LFKIISDKNKFRMDNLAVIEIGRYFINET